MGPASMSTASSSAVISIISAICRSWTFHATGSASVGSVTLKESSLLVAGSNFDATSNSPSLTSTPEVVTNIDTSCSCSITKLTPSSVGLGATSLVVTIMASSYGGSGSARTMVSVVVATSITIDMALATVVPWMAFALGWPVITAEGESSPNDGAVSASPGSTIITYE